MPRRRLEIAGKAGHALWYIGLEADPLLLAVIADVDTGRRLLFDDVADCLVHFRVHLRGVESLAGFAPEQHVGQFVITRQAADMGGAECGRGSAAWSVSPRTVFDCCARRSTRRQLGKNGRLPNGFNVIAHPGNDGC